MLALKTAKFPPQILHFYPQNIHFYLQTSYCVLKTSRFNSKESSILSKILVPSTPLHPVQSPKPNRVTNDELWGKTPLIMLQLSVLRKIVSWWKLQNRHIFHAKILAKVFIFNWYIWNKQNFQSAHILAENIWNRHIFQSAHILAAGAAGVHFRRISIAISHADIFHQYLMLIYFIILAPLREAYNIVLTQFTRYLMIYHRYFLNLSI